MDTIVRCLGLAVTGSLMALAVRNRSGEFAALVGVAVVLMIGALAMEMLSPVVDFAAELRERAGLSHSLLSPVLKTLAIGILTETGRVICEDAGEKAVAAALQFAGGVAAFYVMLPMLRSVLELLDGLM